MAMGVEPRATSPALEYPDPDIDGSEDGHQDELVRL